MYSSRPDEKGHECRTNGPRCSPRKRRTIGRPFISALTDRDLSTVVLRHLEHWNLLWQRKLRQAEGNKLHGQLPVFLLRNNPPADSRLPLIPKSRRLAPLLTEGGPTVRQAEGNKLHEHPKITGAVARQILRSHSFYQLRHNAPFPIASTLYGVVRWTLQVCLPWLLLGLLVCAPIVRAQIVGFDRQAVEIFGTVFLEGTNRPIGGVIVNIRLVTGGSFTSVLTDWGGRFQVRGLDPGRYEIVLEEPGSEPIREPLRLHGPSPPFDLHLQPHT